MTHSHTEPAHATLLFTQPRSPRGCSSDPAAPRGWRRGGPDSSEIRGHQRRKTQAGSWGLATNFIQLQIAPSPRGCSSGGGCSWTHTAHLFLAAHVVYGSWSMAQGPSKKLGQAEGLGPGTSWVRPRSAVVGVQVGE